MNETRLIVALDRPDANSAMALAGQLDPKLCRVKVGLELFTRAGPAVVEALHVAGFEVFLDLKFHDIPNTVAGACRSAAELGVWMLNVHAAGGLRMLEAAREAVDKAGHRPLLVGVTVLTSLAADDLDQLGIPVLPENWVAALAGQVHAAGLDGVVCAGSDAALLKGRFGDGFVLVTPGIRPAGAAAGDQRRVMTPADALRAGADYLVLGRAVTDADDPAGALLTIKTEIDGLPGAD